MPRANRVLENVLGTIGTVCWMGQILPQNWKSWREQSTDGLSASLMLLWAIAAVFLGVYNTVQNINIPLMIQPQLFGALAALSWTQCLYYTHHHSLRFCVTVYVLYCAIGAVFETGMFFVAMNALSKGNSRPVQTFGIITPIVIAIGLLPQYWEILKRNEVVGISYLFIAVDISGAIFSILSLVCKGEFDVLAALTYATVVVMDSAILLAAVILNPRARRRRARERCEGQREETTVQERALGKRESLAEAQHRQPARDVEQVPPAGAPESTDKFGRPVCI